MSRWSKLTKRTKVAILLPTSLLMGGAIATPIVSYELKTNNITSPSNAIDITVAIPANSDIGSIQIIVGETVPNNSQILGAINIWMQTQSPERQNAWHINQVACQNIAENGCTITPLAWSPDYNTNVTTNVVFTTTKPTQQTLRTAMGFSGTGAVSLNDKYSSFLNDQTATSISGLKGDGATIALLRWLDGSDLYAGSLDINQINVTTSLSWVAASNLYSFTINAKNGSNVYTSDSLEVTLTVGRTLINTITDLDTTLDFLTTPADAEVYAQFMYSNNSKITGSNLPATDFTWGSIGLTGVTFTVNGNEYYYTNANVSLTWTATQQIPLATIITTTNLGALVEKPQNNDTVKYLVQQANPSASIQWNEITIGAISDTGVTLTPRTGSIYYTTTALSITWTIA